MSEKDVTKKKLVAKKKVPEVKQTLTSYKRFLNANPLVKRQVEVDLEKNKTGKSVNCPFQASNFPNHSYYEVLKFRDSSFLNDTFKKPVATLNKQKIQPNKDTTKKAPPRYTNYLKSQRNRMSQSAQNISINAVKKTQKTEPKKRQSKSLENLNNESIIFRTPSAYNRRILAVKTPMSTIRKSLFNHCSTPKLPTHAELQERLNKWLLKRGKSLSTYSHLKCLGMHAQKKIEEPIVEENKENIEVISDSSYEELMITPKEKVVNEQESEELAKTALLDLHQLILEGYNLTQCECWLQVIKEKYTNLEKDPHYWECRAAIEEARGNTKEAVEYFQIANDGGTDKIPVDQSLDQLREKFNLLDLSTDVKEEKRGRDQDSRNICRSSMIKFAIQEKSFQQRKNEADGKLVVTPVRRSTRLSRSNYVSTPGIQIYSSLREIDDEINFQSNKALR